MTITKTLISLVLLLTIILSGCELSMAVSPTTMDTEMSSNPSAPPTWTLTVFAAASLTDAFQEIGKGFESANPGVKVNLSFAGSQVLRTQLEQGAVADIFASADHKNMDLIIRDNLVASNSYQDFVTNRLVVILPHGNPAMVETLEDLARPNLKLILVDASVPAGDYARQILSNMSEDPIYGSDFSSSVLANVVSNEIDVRQVVTKVELGEADAGIVYVSDAVAAPDLSTISIPEQYNVIAKYPIAIMVNSPNPDLAAAFVGYVISPAGQAVMNKWGFTQEN
jgi:molybdate transport system substrate-binding protein